MKTLVALIILSLPVLALDNGVRLFDTSGTAQTAQPRTIHRYFAQGEFAAGSYPKPRVAGAVPGAWQVDVESTWPDGSVMAAFVSMPVSIVANGSVTVDFVGDPNPCHLGNAATCQAAALTQQQMLDFNGAAWGVVFEGTANAVTYSASARTMLSAGAWSYRLRGPYVTQVVVEDLTRPNPVYDFGWEYSGGNWQAPSADIYKSIHPLFIVSFYAGWSGVEVEVRAAQEATTRFQRQVFDLSVRRGSTGSVAVYSKTGFDLPRGSAFTRYFWDGSAPAGAQIDFNFKYMIYSRILPPFDYGKARLGSSGVTGYDANVGSTDVQDCAGVVGYCGNWQLYIPGTGGRGDIGLIPAWYVSYLFAMSDTATYTAVQRKEIFDKLVVGNGDAAVTLPIHYLEYDSSTTRDTSADGQRYYFDAGMTVAAFGRVASMAARPEWRSQSDEGTAGDTRDRMPAVCTAGPCSGQRNVDSSMVKGWTIDNAHMPSAFAIPYILTGRYSYLLAQMSLAAYMPAGPPGDCYGYFGRCGSWGLMYAMANQRAAAWSLREVGWGALLSPSSRPEREYFRRILEKNDEMWEGIFGTTGGNAMATGSAMECQGANEGSRGDSHTSASSVDANGWGPYKLNGITKVLGTKGPIYSVTNLTVDGLSKTVGVRGVDVGRDWYYAPGGVAVYQDDSANPVGVASTVSIFYRSTGIVNPWCSGRHITMKGLPNSIGNMYWTVDRQYGSFQLSYMLWVLKWLDDTDAFMHSKTGRRLYSETTKGAAKYALGWALDPDGNPHFADQYASYNSTAGNTLANSWAERIAVIPHTSTLAADVTAAAGSIAIATTVGNYLPSIDMPMPTLGACPRNATRRA